MARAGERLSIARRALASLDDLAGLASPTDVGRDAAVQRFEFTVEAVWKAAQALLLESHGVDAASPKSVARSSHEVGLLAEADARIVIEPIDDRNLTSHTYDEALARLIFGRLGGHAAVMRRWLDAMGRADA